MSWLISWPGYKSIKYAFSWNRKLIFSHDFFKCRKIGMTKLWNRKDGVNHLIQGAEVLELNGIKIYNKVFNDLTLHEIVKSHAENVLDVGNKNTKTSGDMYDPARSIMRSQGYGTHIAWVPIYLKRFKNNESSNAVIELRQALREKYRDRKPFFGQQIAINTSCYYGDKI